MFQQIYDNFLFILFSKSSNTILIEQNNVMKSPLYVIYIESYSI
jgi:hypothetical protein